MNFRFGEQNMNAAAIKKTEIVRELSLLPDHELDRIRMYIESILPASKRPAKNNRSLKGIWSNKGFEKLMGLNE
jgi:hypothetical protein